MQALNQITAQAKPVTEQARAYSTRAWGEIARLALPPPIWFLGECFALGHGRVRLHAIFGQGGLGKSRISMNIARNQVLGLPFGGMPTGTKPRRHLWPVREDRSRVGGALPKRKTDSAACDTEPGDWCRRPDEVRPAQFPGGCVR